MNIEEIKEIYRNRVEQNKYKLDKAKKKGNLLAIIRAALFISVFIYIYFTIEGNTYITVFGSVIIFSFFLFFVKRSAVISAEIKSLKAYIKLNQDEITALNGDYSVFHSGNEFVNPEHQYSYDLDIFGEYSVFQYLNRTSTVGGKIKLAEFLSTNELNKDEILQKQKAIDELSNKIDFRQKYLTEGYLYKDESYYSRENTIKNELINWADSDIKFLNKKFLKILIYLLPVVVIALTILNSIGLIHYVWFALTGAVQLGIVGSYTKLINLEHNLLSRKSAQLSVFEKQLLEIEKQDFKSQKLKSLQDLMIYEDKKASSSLKKLKNTVKAFDNRLNMLYVFISNFFIMRDLHIVMKLEKLKIEYKTLLDKWFTVNDNFDALISLANFSFNNPNYCYPEISDNDFMFDMTEGIHPLLSSEIKVANSFKIDGFGKINIITGANMAGKSTFLRTCGVNLVLAMTGSKVCAQNFSFSPVNIYTSIRTADSITKNESYFYAELQRLKIISEKLENGEELFVIVDEMLRGTNSKDKHEGSRKFIEKLIKFKTSGLVATHDIQLGDLQEKYPQNIKNKRFEVDIRKDTLHFDYKLKDGISKNLNATFLMKKHKIVD